MYTELNKDNCIAYREFNVIKNNINMKFNVMFAKPELGPEGNYYTCSFKLIGPKGISITDKICGYDSMQALTLSISFVFDLMDIHIEKFI